MAPTFVKEVELVEPETLVVEEDLLSELFDRPVTVVEPEEAQAPEQPTPLHR